MCILQRGVATTEIVARNDVVSQCQQAAGYSSHFYSMDFSGPQKMTYRPTIRSSPEPRAVVFWQLRHRDTLTAANHYSPPAPGGGGYRIPPMADAIIRMIQRWIIQVLCHTVEQCPLRGSGHLCPTLRLLPNDLDSPPAPCPYGVTCAAVTRGPPYPHPTPTQSTVLMDQKMILASVREYVCIFGSRKSACKGP